MNIASPFTRVAIAALFLPFTTAASCDGGDREQTGVCPTGEVCSSETPGGLHFIGPVIGEGFFDPGDVKTTAIGGTQDVRLEVEDDAGERAPLLVPHRAELDEPSLAIASELDETLVLRGIGVGDAYLRIVDPVTGELLDRTRVAAARIESVEMMPGLGVASADATLPEVFAYAPGSIAYVRLVAASGFNLVDSSAQLTGAGVVQHGWDRFVVGALAPGRHSVTVTAGDHAPVEVPFDVVMPDRLERHRSWSAPEITRGEPSLQCVVARGGTRPVHASFAFQATGATIELTQFAGCINVTATQLGNVSLHVQAAGLARTFVLTSVPDAATRAVPPTVGPIGDTHGERAAQR